MTFSDVAGLVGVIGGFLDRTIDVEVRSGQRLVTAGTLTDPDDRPHTANHAGSFRGIKRRHVGKSFVIEFLRAGRVIQHRFNLPQPNSHGVSRVILSEPSVFSEQNAQIIIDSRQSALDDLKAAGINGVALGLAHFWLAESLTKGNRLFDAKPHWEEAAWLLKDAYPALAEHAINMASLPAC